MHGGWGLGSSGHPAWLQALSPVFTDHVSLRKYLNALCLLKNPLNEGNNSIDLMGFWGLRQGINDKMHVQFYQNAYSQGVNLPI
jgi:hypothetical protein